MSFDFESTPAELEEFRHQGSDMCQFQEEGGSHNEFGNLEGGAVRASSGGTRQANQTFGERSPFLQNFTTAPENLDGILSVTSASRPSHDAFLHPPSNLQGSSPISSPSPSHLNTGIILAELASLQSRCAVLHSVLIGTSLHSPSPPDYHAATDSTNLDTNQWNIYPSLGASGPISFRADPEVGQDTYGFSMRDDYTQLNDLVGNSLNYEFQNALGFDTAISPSAFSMSTQIVRPVTQPVPSPGQSQHNVVSLANASQGQTRRITAGSRTAGQRRHQCQHCMMTFRRPSDRDRHVLSHNPNAPRFSCPFPACHRVGRAGFLRRDNLAQHQAHMRH